MNTKTYGEGGLRFTITPSRIYVQTSFQTFFLLPRASYWHRRVSLVRAMIELGEVKDLNDLASFCGNYVEWRATTVSLDDLIYNEGRYGKAKV